MVQGARKLDVQLSAPRVAVRLRCAKLVGADGAVDVVQNQSNRAGSPSVVKEPEFTIQYARHQLARTIRLLV